MERRGFAHEGRARRRRRRTHVRGRDFSCRSVERLEPRVLLAAHIAGSATLYSTIQSAVNAATAGAIVVVDPGTYSEQVTVNKSITIRGAQAGVDARSNVRQSATGESVLSLTSGSFGFNITAGDVTIDGFTIQGSPGISASQAGIVIAPNESGAHILNNIVEGNVTGMYLANASSTDAAIIQYNVFALNNVPGPNGGRAIYTDGGVSGGVLQNVTIDSNFFYSNLGGTGTSGVEAAIGLEGHTSIQTNIRITNNTFESNGKAVLALDASNLTITGNTITDSQAKDSAALRFGGGLTNITIQNNNIYYNLSPAVRIDTGSVAIANVGFTITNNNIYGNGYVDLANPPSGIVPGSVVLASGAMSDTLNLQNNWWGSSTGPGGDAPGSGDVLRTGGNTVTYSPFSSNSVVTQASPFDGLAGLPDQPIQAVNFDQGGSGIGFLAGAGTVNATMSYRQTAVPTETTTDSGESYGLAYDVAGLVAGQWLAYTVNIPVSGTYRLDLRVATAQATGGTLHAALDGTAVGGTLAVPNTGGAQNWQTISTASFNATAGQHVLKLLFDTNGSGGTVGSIHWLQLTTLSTASTPPSAPTNLLASAASSSQINLTWVNTAVNQTGFEVDRSTDGSHFSPLNTVPPNVTLYADTGLASSTSYYYRVEATNAAGASPASNVAQATTATILPTQINLTDLTWDSATTGFGTVQLNQSIKGNPIMLRGIVYPRGIGTHAVSQIIYKLNGQYNSFVSDAGIDDEITNNGGTGSVDFQVIGDGNVLFDSGVVTNHSPIVHINVSVVGVQQLTLVVNNGVPNDLSNDHADWAGPLLFGGTPQPPSNLQASAAANQVLLNWTPSIGAVSYNVYRGTTTGGELPTAIATGVPSTSFTDSSVTAGASYYYKVTAVNAVGVGPQSAEALAIASQAPASPSALTASSGINQISLSWLASPGAASYSIYRGTAPGAESTTAVATGMTATSFDDTGLTTGTAYYYQITAVNAVGQSAKSGEVSATVLQPPAHVVVVIEENKDFDQIMGSSAAPYINSLGQQGAYFSSSHATNHPSQPNYLSLFSGSTQGVLDDTVPPNQFGASNLASQLIAGGLSFTGYAEDLPSAGSLVVTAGASDAAGNAVYQRYHNPWSEFSSVPSADNQPFSVFPTNFNSLPTVSFIVPNMMDDMHDGTVTQGDQWLQTNLAAYATWAQAHNSLLIVTWDENNDENGGTDTTGNQVATIIYGQQVRPGTYSENVDHFNVLGTLESEYGLSPLGLSAGVSAIQEIWQAPPVAVSGLQATSAANQITLNWTPSSGATGYNIYRGTTPGGEGATPIASNVSAATYIDASVATGTTYSYQVTAVNGAGESGRGSEVIAGAQSLPAPSNLKAIGGIEQVAVNWTASAGATSYKIYRGIVSGGEFPTAIATNITTTGFTDTAVTPGFAYYYQVTAVNTIGESDRSTETSATVVATPAHVVVVIESHFGSGIIGSPSAPYLNSLVNGGALFNNATGITYPAQPNYLGLFSGSTQNVADDTVPTSQFSTANLGSELIAAGLTFTGYAEGLPSVGSLVSTAGSTDSSGNAVYQRYHNPWSDFSNVPTADNQPFTAFPTTFTSLPSVSFVVPNMTDDFHDGTVSQADTWLQTNIAAYATWATTNDSLLIVTWDDNVSGANPNQINTILYGPQVQTGTYADAINHYSLLRTIEDLYGVTRLGSAATASTIQSAWHAMGVTPPAPTGLQSSTAGPQQIDLTWTAGSGATSYDVYRGTTPGGEDATPVATNVTTTTYNDTGLTPGVNYYYQVTALNSSGESGRSTESAAATQKATPVFSGLSTSATIIYGTTGVAISGTISAGTLIPTGSVTVTINGSSTNALVDSLSGAFSTSFDTHAIPASVTAYSITYTYAANSTYNAGTDTSTSLTVNKRVLAIIVTAQDKSYDGTTAATVTLSDNRVNNDSLTVAYASAAFVDKNVGTNKTVTVSGITLSGMAAGNYTFNTTAATTANITPELSISGTGAADSITLALDADGQHIDWFLNGGTIGQLAMNDPAGLTINGNGSNDAITLQPTGSGAPTLPNTLHLNGTFTVNGLSGSNPLANTNMEIGRSTVFLNYTVGNDPLALIQNYLKNGYNNGSWTGSPTASTGVITSTPAAQNAAQTTAIGYADSADRLIAGQPANTIELKYTLYGDTRLAGNVGFNDFTTLTQHYNQTSGGTWDTGDFNYDGSVNFGDFTLMTRTYNTSLGSQASPAASPAAAAASATAAPVARIYPPVDPKTVMPTHGKHHAITVHLVTVSPHSQPDKHYKKRRK